MYRKIYSHANSIRVMMMMMVMMRCRLSYRGRPASTGINTELYYILSLFK